MIRQIVVVNMAVPMDFSQLSVQVAHASMLGVLNQGQWVSQDNQEVEDLLFINCIAKPELMTWLKDHFTLVVCKVWGKKTIMELEAEAKRYDINTAIMEDYGHTTALAIGPASEEKLLPFKRLTLL